MLRHLQVQNRYISFLLDTIVIATLYILLAQVGYKMALIEGLIPSFWPPAGLALAVIIQLGRRSAPGIWLGAFFATLLFYRSIDNLHAYLIMMAVKASGVTLQVIVCGWWITRCKRSLKNPSYLKHFGLLAVITALSSTISSTVDVINLYGTGWISADKIAIIFIDGWITDWLSTLAFTPLFITTGMWLKRKPFQYHPALMIISGGLIMSLLIFSTLWNNETKQIQNVFNSQANGEYNALSRTIQLAEYNLDSLAAFVVSHDDVSKDDFDAFVAYDHNEHKVTTGARAFAWIPYITAGNLKTYEAIMPLDGTRYKQVMERTTTGELKPAGSRAEYFPVRLLTPQGEGEIFEQGLDLGSIPAIREALITARDSGEVTTWIQTPSTSKNGQGKILVIVRPVYRAPESLENLGAHQNNILGFVLGIYPVDDLLNAALLSLDIHAGDLSLINLYITQGEQLLSFRISSTTLYSTLPNAIAGLSSSQGNDHYIRQLSFDNQNWQVLIEPAPGWERNLRSPIPWFAVETGLIITILVVIVLIYRQQAEQMKFESDERMQLAMENAEVNYWFYDHEKDEIKVSEKLAEALELPDSLIKDYQEIYKFFLPEDLEQFHQLEKSVKHDGLFPYTELRVKLPNKEVAWIGLFGKVNRDASGKIINTVGGLQNISRRKKNEEELRESEERYRKLVEYSPDTISLEVDGKFVYINEPGLRLIGVEKLDDALGRELLEFVHPDYREIATEWIRQLNRGQSIFSNLEIQIQKPDGTTVDTNLISVPIVYMGKPGGLLISHNTPGEKHLQNFILDNQDNLRSYIDFAPMAILIGDRSGRLVAENQAAKVLLGYEEQELVSIHFADLLTEDSLEKSESFVEGIRKEGYAKDEFEVKTCSNGVIWVSARVISIEDNRLMAFLQDVTEIRQAEQKLLYQAKLLANVRDAIIAVDEESAITSWNPAAEAIYGWREDEVLGLNVDEVLNTEFIGSTKENLIQWISETDNFAGEVRQQDKDGNWLLFESHVRSIRGSKGQLTGMVTVNRDITVRKQAENDLKEQKEILQEIFDHIPLMINFIASDGRIKLANREWHNIIGWTQAELQNQNVIDLFQKIFPDPIDRQKAFSDLSFPQQKWRDLKTHTKSGRDIDSSWITIILTDGTNIAIGQDVTELRKVERIEKVHARVSSILASSLKLTDALVQVMEAISTQLNWQVAELWWIDPESKNLRWKAGWHEKVAKLDAFEENCRSIQYASAESLPEITWREGICTWYEDFNREPLSGSGCLLPTEAAELHAAVVVPIIDNGHVFGLMTFFNSSTCPFDQQLFDMLGDISRQTGQFVARTQAEQTLARAEEGYRMLFEEAPVIYIITRNETDGPVLSDCNNLFLSALGYTREKVIGRPIADFLSPESRRNLLENGYQLALKGKLGPEEQDLVTRDGRILQGILYTVPDKDRDGKVIGTRSIHVDITERKRMEQDLQNERAMLARRVEERTAELSILNARLLQANRAKDEFLANMSHELRTPLNGILAFSETLLEETRGPLNERQQRAVHNIETSGMHLLALINDILDLSKIEAGKLDIQMETIWVNEVCQASLIFVKETANKKHIQVEYHCDQPNLCLQSDPRRLKQILVNLLSNAVKFTPEGGEVHLSVNPDPVLETIQLSVRDTGIGISKADQQRLFRPFVQIDSSLTRQQEGTGLGLALVRRLVELHGGSVSLESEVGKGSCFTVSLPWKDPRQPVREEQQATTCEAAKRLEKMHGGKKVLLAEDNELNIEAVGEYLKDCGFDLRVARNGKEALDFSSEFGPDLILMDIQMPIMDGLQAIRKLRDAPYFQQTPIIAMTALVMSGDRERCLQAGANEYIGKPVNLRLLVQIIERLLGINS